MKGKPEMLRAKRTRLVTTTSESGPTWDIAAEKGWLMAMENPMPSVRLAISQHVRIVPQRRQLQDHASS